MVLHARQAVGLALSVAVVALVAGCGGGGGGAPAKRTTSTESEAAIVSKDLGVDVRLADCTNWNKGSRAARLGTIHEISTAVPDQAKLSDAQAYRLFDGWCSQRYATAFKLYKLYTRAAAFTPQTP